LIASSAAKEIFMTPIVAIAVVFATSVLLAVMWERRRQAKFEQKFPPISDDEFVARCGPGTNAEIALKVRRIVSDQLGVQYERIYPESSFVNDLGAD
jgi:hypothetical protein